MMRLLSNYNDAVRTAIRVLGGPLMRLSIILIFCVLSAYLGYSHAYTPLFDDVELPAVVQARNVRIDMKALDAIDAATIQRRNHIPHTYTQYRMLFAPIVDE